MKIIRLPDGRIAIYYLPCATAGGKGPTIKEENVSLRRRVLRVVALATAVAMVFGAFAGSASAKKISKKQKAAITKQLRKQIKKNPRAIRSKKFLRRAALVNFKLPVTIRLRGECPAGSGGAASCPATGGTRQHRPQRARQRRRLTSTSVRRSVSVM